MAKKATAKATSGGKKTAKNDSDGAARDGQSRPLNRRARSPRADIVDALIKLLQSPLVIDLLAVGATAALAAITETRSSRTQGAIDARGSKKALKAAGKAAAAAVGRRIQNEFEEITRRIEAQRGRAED